MLNGIEVALSKPKEYSFWNFFFWNINFHAVNYLAQFTRNVIIQAAQGVKTDMKWNWKGDYAFTGRE